MKVNTEFKEVKGIGNIPVDWEVKELKDVASITMGQSPGSENYNDEKIGLPLIQGNADCINRKTCPRIWTSEITKTCDSGDIIMTVRAPAGSVYKSIHRGCIGRGVCAIKYKNNTDYLYHYLIKNELHWDKLAQGTTFTAINSSDVNSFKIALPNSIKEQEKIAQILSNVDMNIEKAEQAISKYKQVKKGLMDDLLTGKIRIKDGKRFRETRFKDIKDVGRIPWDWEAKKLGDFARIQRGASPRPIEDIRWFSENSNIGWVRISDVTGSTKFLNKTKQYLSKDGVNNSRFIEKGNLILSICATVGKPIILNMDVCIHDGFVGFFDLKRKNISLEYLYYFLKLNEQLVKQKGQVGTQLNLNSDLVSNTVIIIPTKIEEQNYIANLLSKQDDIIEREEKYLEKLKKLKLGLMKDLLTGKVRVNID